MFVFFKQNTAYELRISDWSSDVCSSDLLARAHGPGDSLADDAHTVRTHTHVVCTPEQLAAAGTPEAEPPTLTDLLERDLVSDLPAAEIGRAPCRERVCTYV